MDFWRATAERGILTTLEVHGLSATDISIVDLPIEEPEPTLPGPIHTPADLYQSGVFGSAYRSEVDALLRGRVEAIYSNRGRATNLEAEGKVKVIEDLGRYPDWTLQVANSPYTITVSDQFAEEHPAAVTAYLRAAIRAGRWISQNAADAAGIFRRVTHYRTGSRVATTIAQHDFVPSLSNLNIAGLELEKQFLLEHDYIQRDFDIRQWIDGRFLEEALRSA